MDLLTSQEFDAEVEHQRERMSQYRDPLSILEAIIPEQERIIEEQKALLAYLEQELAIRKRAKEIFVAEKAREGAHA